MQPHATMLKFGYPDSVLASYERWTVMLRNQQVTLGSLVLVCTEDATAFPEISVQAFTELKKVTADIERALAATFAYDRINYLMLRMVDPHVHFHVLPRYEAARTFEGQSYSDPAWPRPPDLSATVALSEDARKSLMETLRKAFR